MLQFSIITITTFVTILNNIVIYIADKCFPKVAGENFKKYIPLFSIAFGLILGVIGYLTPNVEMGNNMIEAIFIGLSAGSAATGIDQIGKQLD